MTITRATLVLLACLAAPTAIAAPQTSTAPSESTGSELGQRAPAFELPSSAGPSWDLVAQRGRPVVLAFFRGAW